MERYKYRAMNARGRQVRGVMSAANEVDLYNQLQSSGLELLQSGILQDKKNNPLAALSFGSKVKVRDLIQFFMQMEQMQGAGVSMLDALGDVRDTTDNQSLRDIMSEVYRDVSEGSSLSEALSMHPKVFNSLYISLVASGEETGDLRSVYKYLIEYLKWVDEMKSKIKKATSYPKVVSGVVLLVVTIMMWKVVPEIIGFVVDGLGQDIPFYTKALKNTSDFFIDSTFGIPNAVFVLGAPFLIALMIKIARNMSDDIAYNLDKIAISLPVAGVLVRKINIARFMQTFGALFASGIDVLKSIQSAKQTVSNRVLQEALDKVYERVKAGEPLSTAFNETGEFPSMVIRIIRIGEESGNLTEVLAQVSEFYTKDVDEAVQGLIAMVEPLLTGIMGILILWIAAAVFGPIYDSIANLDL